MWRTLKYANASENPTPGQRTIQVYASDGRHVGPAVVAIGDSGSVNTTTYAAVASP